MCLQQHSCISYLNETFVSFKRFFSTKKKTNSQVQKNCPIELNIKNLVTNGQFMRLLVLGLEIADENQSISFVNVGINQIYHMIVNYKNIH